MSSPVSVRFNNEEEEQLKELMEHYNNQLHLNLNRSQLIKMLVQRDYMEKIEKNNKEESNKEKA